MLLLLCTTATTATAAAAAADAHATTYALCTPQVPSDARGVRLEARVMPSPAATLLSALEALIREPCGCFEQTSATTYPMVMALRYFETHQGELMVLGLCAGRAVRTDSLRCLGVCVCE